METYQVGIKDNNSLRRPPRDTKIDRYLEKLGTHSKLYRLMAGYVARQCRLDNTEDYYTYKMLRKS